MKAEKEKQQNLNFEIEFLEKLLDINPNYVDALTLLGELFTRNKEFQKALEIDLKLAEFKPQDAIVFYNLACDYSLLDKKTLGLKALEKAFQLGYADLDYLIKDQDLKNLRESKRFQTLIETWKNKNLSSNIS
ncbi:MAG: tetratricopeptide repeat protein [Candidatus Saelkia tenebricola]|nr:tetratricopeptide repeat protein [Candidatus Saelkia tenebricola]